MGRLSGEALVVVSGYLIALGVVVLAGTEITRRLGSRIGTFLPK